jgi:quinone-modifying oxidoreductase subunit QmoA
MEPSVDASKIMKGVAADASGFIDINATTEAVFGAGCASNALDVNRSVQSATAGALRAIQVVNRVSRAEV